MPPRLVSPRTLSIFSYCCRPIASTSNSTRSLANRGNEVLRTRGFLTGARACRSGSGSKLGRKRAFHSSPPLSSAPKDPYQVLGVAKDASAAEIKRTYFQLAKKFHPDTNTDAKAKDHFVEIQTAYDILGDEKKRAEYDRFGSASQQPGFDPNAFANARGPFGAGGFGGFQDFSGAFGGGHGRSPQDIFDSLFGSAFAGGPSARGRTRGFESVRGDDIESNVSVSFLDACKGVTRSVNVTPVVDCGTCSGSGLKAGAKRSACASCGGTGTRTFVIDSGFQMASTCQTCHGSGTTVPRGSQCGECSGLGKVKLRKQVKVDVPAGVEDGMTIRVPGAGDMPISGKGPAGDLLVRVSVAPSKIFRRQGVNIHHDTRIPLHTALLGGKVRVPTLDGDVEVRVPAGTQPGEECVLKGRGVTPVFGGDKGDLFISFMVQIPRSLPKRQRAIIEEYAREVEGRSQPADSNPNSADPPPGNPQQNDDSLDEQDDVKKPESGPGRKKQQTATA